MNILRIFALAACAAAIGCDFGSQQSRGVHQVSWSIWSADSPSVAGIDEACVLFATYGDSAAITFWIDGPGGSFGAGFDKAHGAAHYSGSVKSQDARTINIEAFTADGKAGDVMIDGQKFDLAKGSLFLVKTAEGETQVRQSTLKIPEPNPDTGHAESTTEALRQFGKSSSEISAFYGMRDEG